MVIQCRACKRIQEDGQFRLPWPGELGGAITEVYCSRCAQEVLVRIQSGEFARMAERRAEQRLRAAP